MIFQKQEIQKKEMRWWKPLMMVALLMAVGLVVVPQTAVASSCSSWAGDWVDIFIDSRDTILTFSPSLMTYGGLYHVRAWPTVAVLDLGIRVKVEDRTLRTVDEGGLFDLEEVYIRFMGSSGHSDYRFSHADLEICSPSGGCGTYHLDRTESFDRALRIEVFAYAGAGFYSYCGHWD